jgi:hypothetical protein
VKNRFAGCSEAYPRSASFNVADYSNCTDQNDSPPGYGDGYGGYTTGGDWVIKDTEFSHNTSDGMDLLYHDGTGSITIQRSLFEGNNGNQFKATAPAMDIQNSVFIGNCNYLKAAGKVKNTSSWNSCRAGADAIALTPAKGGTYKFTNSIFYNDGNAQVAIGDRLGTCDGSETYTFRNNVYVGNGVNSLYINALGGNCLTPPLNTDYSIVYNHTGACPNGSHNKCSTNPGWMGAISQTANTNISNVALQSSSPAIENALIIAGTTTLDYSGKDRGTTTWDIGALQYASSGIEIIPPPTVICGNGILETGEQCDGASLNSQTCLTKGFAGGGILACSNSCTFNTASCKASACGNAIVETGEQCDSGNLNNQTCSSQGFTGGGILACNNACTFNTTSCKANACGNSIVEAGEQCDGSNLNSKTCSTQGFTGGGTLACSNTCTFNTVSCKTSTCGNAIVETGEQCDGANLNTQTCSSQGFTNGGTLSCSNTCAFNTSSCKTTATCGNGIVDAGEQCDGSSLNGQTCYTRGFNGGSLGCSQSCTLDISSCSKCGNYSIDTGEECDVTNLNGQTCSSKGFTGGALSCYSTCKLNTTSCTKTTSTTTTTSKKRWWQR